MSQTTLQEDNSGFRVEDVALAALFLEARTHTTWQPRSVGDNVLRELYDLMKWAPTSMNSSPARLVFVTSTEGKERLVPTLSPGNVEKARSAPVTVIVAHDTMFQEYMPTLFPANPNAQDLFAGNDALREATAFRNGTLQGAYLILAARALGLDCGPMSGFDNAKVDAEFFPDGRWKSNFLVNLGYGDAAGVFPRNPRLDFDEVCRIV
ncbi:MAG: malonic semialdehyde reductase [Acidihalobacter sp.]|uniref:malonic semialdehyde reductase n=1 Tax=Acidihalobacter sp. TaxID=1872108 RepID=UPI00307D3729